MIKALDRQAAAALISLGTIAALTLLPARAAAQDHDAHMAGASGLPHNIPNFCANATIRSAGSGAWSSASSWTPARVPGAGDKVYIEAGHAISYALVSDTAVSCVGVAGQLGFATTSNTRLKVGTLEVLPTGTLTVGTPTDNVRAGVTAEIVIANQALDTAADPEQFGVGIVGMGVVQMAGSPKTPYVRMQNEPKAGNTSLVAAAAPSGWAAGDRLALPDSKQWRIESGPYVQEWETTTLASVNGTTLGLTGALAYNHPGARNGDDVLEFLPHLANLTRNVIVRSEAPAGTRGHVIFTARANIDIRYVLLKDLGRTRIEVLNNTTFDSGGTPTHIGTNQIGRYSMHFHHLMGPTAAPANGYQYTFIGNAIDGATKWGIAIHQSNYGQVTDNVVYDSLGAGLMTEDGNESYNLIARNYVLVVRGTGEERADARLTEFGFEGSAFWFHGPYNYVRDNVGASANSFGYTYAMLNMPSNRTPKFPGADLTVDGQYDTRDLKATPLLEFAGNELYGTRNGLTVWDLGAQCCENVRETPTSTVKNYRSWHISRYGFYGYGQNKVEFDGWVQRGEKAALANSFEWFLGFYFGDYITRNLVIRNSDLQNLRTGIQVPNKAGDTRDIYGNAPGTILIENTTLRNSTNIYVGTPWAITGGGTVLPPRKTTISNVKFGQVNSSVGGATQFNIQMGYSTTNTNPNLVQMDEVSVTSYNQDPSLNFRVFYTQQAPTFVVPQSAGGIVGASVSGMTNQQTWSTFGLAIAGSIAPCTTTRGFIQGYTCTLSSLPPSAPRNLRITQ
jgi:hypothetical protein